MVAAVRNPAELGALIRARRLEKDLTQTELAELCGVSLRFITELERGVREAGVSKVLRVCARLALDVTVTPRERGESSS
jgi:transcriptional regulator with XRE-family HTH domain